MNGAPSRAAHVAFVDAALSLAERVDPRVLDVITLGWTERTSELGSALVVPAGCWHTSTRYGARQWSPRARQAPCVRAFVWLSASAWPRLPASHRGDTIAHELAHVSDGLDVLEALGPNPDPLAAVRAERRKRPHGPTWQLWALRYGAPPVAGLSRGVLTGAHAGELGRVALRLDLVEKRRAA